MVVDRRKSKCQGFIDTLKYQKVVQENNPDYYQSVNAMQKIVPNWQQGSFK